MSQVRCPTTKVLSPTNTAKAIWDLMRLMEPKQGRLPGFLENGWKEMMTTGYIKRRELWMVAVSCFRPLLPLSSTVNLIVISRKPALNSRACQMS